MIAVINQSNKKKAAANKNSGGGENFPFPDSASMPYDKPATPKTPKEFDPWDFKTLGDLLKGEPVSVPPIQNKPKPIESEKIEVVPPEIVPKSKANKNSESEVTMFAKKLSSNEAKQEDNEKKKVDFDIKKAIIYSEILTPKFKGNL